MLQWAKDYMSTEEALALFDRSETVSVEMMLGKWEGAEIATDHPMDGLLAASRWTGKEFHSSEEVYPLVHKGFGGRDFRVNPALMPIGLAMKLPWLRKPVSTLLFLAAEPIITARKSKARLRMTEHRGTTSATMIYDDKPIHDVFRKLDDENVLGLMDMKNMDRPYFFRLRRIGDR